MRKKTLYSTDWEKATSIEPELNVLRQEEKFNRERKKMENSHSKMRQIRKVQKNLDELTAEIQSLSQELGEDANEYLYQTTPRTKFEKTSYFAKQEPLDVDLLRRTISQAVDEDPGNRFSNLDNRSHTTSSEISAQNLSLKAPNALLQDTEENERRRMSMLRLSQTVNGLSSQELRSATKYETEMSMRELQSKSFQKSSVRKRKTSQRDFNKPPPRQYPTARKPYVPANNRIAPVDSELIRLHPPTLNKTIYKRASIVCDETNELLSRVLQ